MASYDEWNQALLSYFTKGIQRGSSVFLSVDDDVLDQIGRAFQVSGEEAIRDFCQAAQMRVVVGERLHLGEIRGRYANGDPKGLAFLAAMVLAASRMADSEEASQLNYFRRLREVLNLPTEDGRPRGMETGAEADEPLWREWALWLQENGFLPSARRGEGAKTYINYPISQSLLRGADKDRLRRLFQEKHWPQDMDVEMLSSRIRRETGTLTQHLQELLNSPIQRYQAAIEAIHEVYETWQINRSFSQNVSYTSHMLSGVLRSEDASSGLVQYFLYPRNPHRRHTDQIQILVSEELITLIEDQAGWYVSGIPINEEILNQGARYKIEQPSDLDWLIFPKKQFWILIPDPENPDSGAYASWGPPQLGTPFILLCQKGLVSQLEDLRNERLIEWKGEPRSLFNREQWVEIINCMVVSQAWSGIFTENPELCDALAPRTSLSVSLSGGLRAPELGGWVDGEGPQITVYGFHAEASVCITRDADEYKVIDRPQQTNRPFTVEWPGPGNYRVEAECGGEIAERLIKIVTWEQLQLASPEHREIVSLGTGHISGAYIDEKS